MVLMRSLLPGTKLSASGSFRLEPLLDDLSVTPTMSSPFPSPPITDKSFLVQEIVQLSCGTPLVTASLPSPRRDTPNGFPASGSARIHKILSLSAAVGISWLRSVKSLYLRSLLEPAGLYDATQF